MPLMRMSGTVSLTVSRRQLLRLAVSVPALSFLGGCEPDGGSAAYLGWQGPPVVSDIRMRLAGWASLAPSSYNLQPWKIALEGDDVLWLLADADRTHPRSDPLLRQVTLGQGTFLELLVLAAAAEGWKPSLTLFPDGPYTTRDEMRLKPVARVVLSRDPAVLPPVPFAAVRQRRTCRGPFTGRAISRAVRDLFLAGAGAAHGVSVGWIDRGVGLERLKGLVIEAIRRESMHPGIVGETAGFLRLTEKEIVDRRDGVVPPSPFPGGGVRLFYGRHAFSEPGSWLNRWAFSHAVARVGEADSFVWISTDGDSRDDQVRAGRVYAGLDLAAATQGLAIQPLSAPLGDWDGVAGIRREMHALLSIPGRRIQMLARVGYADNASPAPRRSVVELMI